jgi:hypothetical protein
MNQEKFIKNEVELAEEVKGFINSTIDVSFANENLKEEIMNFKNDDFILVQKQISSPTKILSVVKLDEENMLEYYNKEW